MNEKSKPIWSWKDSFLLLIFITFLLIILNYNYKIMDEYYITEERALLDYYYIYQVVDWGADHRVYTSNSFEETLRFYKELTKK